MSDKKRPFLAAGLGTAIVGLALVFNHMSDEYESDALEFFNEVENMEAELPEHTIDSLDTQTASFEEELPTIDP